MRNEKVDDFLAVQKKWQAELTKLRMIALDCHLEEGFKWMHPCYMFQGKNICLIHGFKEYVAIMFMKGSLLQDSEGILYQQTDQVQSGRQIRFTNIQEIEEIEATLKQYIYEAIEVEKAGLKVAMKAHEDYEVVEEFQATLDSDESLKTAFFALTPGRQRAYLIHFSGAKQSATRTARIEKYTDAILAGRGINDCTCGLSKKMPYCDGSHKSLSVK